MRMKWEFSSNVFRQPKFSTWMDFVGLRFFFVRFRWHRRLSSVSSVSPCHRRRPIPIVVLPCTHSINFPQWMAATRTNKVKGNFFSFVAAVPILRIELGWGRPCTLWAMQINIISTYIDDKPRMLASIVVSFGILQKNELCSGLAFTFERQRGFPYPVM